MLVFLYLNPITIINWILNLMSVFSWDILPLIRDINVCLLLVEFIVLKMFFLISLSFHMLTYLSHLFHLVKIVHSLLILISFLFLSLLLISPMCLLCTHKPLLAVLLPHLSMLLLLSLISFLFSQTQTYLKVILFNSQILFNQTYLSLFLFNPLILNR